MTNEDLTPQPGRWVRRLETVMAATGAALLAFLLFQLAWFRFGSDQAILAVVGDGLAHGELPYRDRWSMHLPGAYLFYAVGQLLFGKTMMAVRLVEAGMLLSLFVAFPIYSRRFLGSAAPGFAGALLATLTHVQLGFWNTAQPETFGGVVLVWAVLLATWQPAGFRLPPSGGTSRGQVMAWIASGALFAVAALCRPLLGGGFVLCLALLVRDRYRTRGDEGQSSPRGRDGLIQPILAFAAGGAVVVAATLLPYVVAGAAGELVWTFRDVVPGHLALVHQGQGLLSGVFRAASALLFRCSPYFFPGLVLWALLPPLAGRERVGVLYLLAAVGLSLCGFAVEGKPFHNVGGMIHLVALWSAWGYTKLWRRVSRQPVAAVLFLVALIAVHDAVKTDLWRHSGSRWQAYRHPEQRAEIMDQLDSHRHHWPKATRNVAQWLRAHTEPDARVLVWGPQAAIYFESDRRPASRFVTNLALRFPWCAGRAKKLLRQDIEAAPPAVIVVSRADAWPRVTGNSFDSAQALRRIPWLNELLVTRYQRVGRFNRLVIYRLRTEFVTGAPAKVRPICALPARRST